MDAAIGAGEKESCEEDEGVGERVVGEEVSEGEDCTIVGSFGRKPADGSDC